MNGNDLHQNSGSIKMFFNGVGPKHTFGNGGVTLGGDISLTGSNPLYVYSGNIRLGGNSSASATELVESNTVDNTTVTLTLPNTTGTLATTTSFTAGNGLTLTGTEFTMSGAYTGDFTASGDVTAYSDKRLKRNIETISNPVDIVNCLRGVNFEKDGRHSTGVIAQEVEEFLPEVVHTDAEGMKSVAYGNISGLLIEAIKEQQQTIENLQKQITDLQNKNS